MPLTSKGSYIGVMEMFIAHWHEANLEIGPPLGVLILPDGYAVANLDADRAAIQASLMEVIGAENHRQVAVEDYSMRKEALNRRIAQFNRMVRALLEGTSYPSSLTKVPAILKKANKFLDPHVKARTLWGHINADPDISLTLTLPDGYALADYSADIQACQDRVGEAEMEREDERIARDRRDLLLKAALERLKSYRLMVLANFPSGHPMVTSLPKLSRHSVATPKPVILTGISIPETGIIDLSWTQSPARKLDHISIRTAPGPVYLKKNESVIGRADKAATSLSLNRAQFPPGEVILIRAYVVLTTGNEKGSNTIELMVEKLNGASDESYQ